MTTTFTNPVSETMAKYAGVSVFSKLSSRAFSGISYKPPDLKPINLPGLEAMGTKLLKLNLGVAEGGLLDLVQPGLRAAWADTMVLNLDTKVLNLDTKVLNLDTKVFSFDTHRPKVDVFGPLRETLLRGVEFRWAGVDPEMIERLAVGLADLDREWEVELDSPAARARRQIHWSQLRSANAYLAYLCLLGSVSVVLRRQGYEQLGTDLMDLVDLLLGPAMVLVVVHGAIGPRRD